MKYNNLIEVTKYFSYEKVCKEHLEKLRWNGKPICPHCQHDKVYKTKAGYKCADQKCYKKFTVLVGTFFENTKIPLSKWFVAIYITTSHKKGISSLQLSGDISVTQKSAWFMLQRIREMLKANAPDMLEGTVEVDETYFGGKEKNKHKSKKIGLSGTAGKQAVIGACERKGKVVAGKIKNTSREDLHQFVNTNIETGSTIFTDEHSGYDGLVNFDRGVINHSAKQFVNGIIHTNTIEGFWSY